MFIREYHEDAKILATQLNVPAEFILGLAAHESQFGRANHLEETQNYFSLHSRSPGEKNSLHEKEELHKSLASDKKPDDAKYELRLRTSGEKSPHQQKSGHHRKLSMFDSFIGGGRSFLAKYGHLIQNLKDDQRFVDELVACGFHLGKQAEQPAPHWDYKVLVCIRMVKECMSHYQIH
jgi:hypothetical protein